MGMTLTKRLAKALLHILSLEAALHLADNFRFDSRSQVAYNLPWTMQVEQQQVAVQST